MTAKPTIILVLKRAIMPALLLLYASQGLMGCAARGPAAGGPHLPGPEAMGPAGPEYLLAQADEKDPFADPTEEELDFLDELEDETPPTLVADPLEPWNRFMFQVNDRIYFWLLKPVARGYRWAVPTIVRRGVKNFFYNIGMPVRVVNNVFQGHPRGAAAELGRFFVNTTEGILGLGNPAGRYPELTVPTEDLGQTFGRYGIGNGFYIVWPFFGPYTLRDTVGLVGDAFMDPVSIFNVVDTEVWLGLKGLDVVNETSFRIGDYEAVKAAALDPYAAMRNGYIQRRDRQIQEYWQK